MAITKIVTPNSITVFANGKTLVAASSHPNFKAISDYLKTPGADETTVAAMFDIPAAIKTLSKGLVEVRGNTVFYAGKELHNTLTSRMMAMLRDGFDISPLVNFLEKLMRNPSHRAVTGLYDFLEATHIPITPEGNFLAYKKVRGNYLDIHSGTIRNAPGDAPRVPRNQVDEDPDRTCSHGLHVCSASYLQHFGSCNGSDRVVVVEVSPEDVVAIPRDYNNAKMRCAGYKVIGEVPNGTKPEAVFSKAVMSAPDLDPAGSMAAAPVAAKTFQQNDRIINIEGIPVRFVLEDDDYEDEDTWVAYYTDSDGSEQTYVSYEADLEDAIESFKEDRMNKIETWTATIRYLDDNGGVVNVLSTVEHDLFAGEDGGEEPDDWEFSDVYEGDLPNHFVVLNKTLKSTKLEIV